MVKAPKICDDFVSQKHDEQPVVDGGNSKIENASCLTLPDTAFGNEHSAAAFNNSDHDDRTGLPQADVLPGLLTTSETAFILRCCSKTVRRYVKSGTLTGTKVGGVWRFSAMAVRALLVAGMVRENLIGRNPSDQTRIVFTRCDRQDQIEIKPRLFPMK